MSTSEKYYAIESYEWLLPTGDASKLLVRYSTADDDKGIQNRADSSVVIKLHRDQQRDAELKDETDKAKLIIGFFKGRIERAMKTADDLPSEMTITSYDKDFPRDPTQIELRIGEWCKVITERKMGFLS